MKDCPSVSALAKELDSDRGNLFEWQRQLERGREASARVTSPVRELRNPVRALHVPREEDTEVRSAILDGYSRKVVGWNLEPQSLYAKAVLSYRSGMRVTENRHCVRQQTG